MGNNRSIFLDTVKGICIIFIIVTHFYFYENERLIALFPYWIDMAVPIFMIITGFLYSISYDKNNICDISEAYGIAFIGGKIIRFTSPFAMAYVIELVVSIIKNENNSILYWGQVFLTGGLGPGSYYYPILIQFIFIFPVLFFLIKNDCKKGLVICFIINIVYEIMQRAYSLNEECYRLLIFRYIFIIGFGIFLYFYKHIISYKVLSVMSVIGGVFIFLVEYTDYKPYIIIYWTRTSVIAVLWIIPIFYILWHKFYNTLKSGIIYRFLSILGKASYNIFLTQMVYYMYMNSYMVEILQDRMVNLIFNIIICLTVGVVFYYVERNITKFIQEKFVSVFNKYILGVLLCNSETKKQY